MDATSTHNSLKQRLREKRNQIRAKERHFAINQIPPGAQQDMDLSMLGDMKGLKPREAKKMVKTMTKDMSPDQSDQFRNILNQSTGGQLGISGSKSSDQKKAQPKPESCYIPAGQRQSTLAPTSTRLTAVGGSKLAVDQPRKQKSRPAFGLLPVSVPSLAQMYQPNRSGPEGTSSAPKQILPSSSLVPKSISESDRKLAIKHFDPDSWTQSIFTEPKQTRLIQQFKWLPFPEPQSELFCFPHDLDQAISKHSSTDFPADFFGSDQKITNGFKWVGKFVYRRNPDPHCKPSHQILKFRNIGPSIRDFIQSFQFIRSWLDTFLSKDPTNKIMCDVFQLKAKLKTLGIECLPQDDQPGHWLLVLIGPSDKPIRLPWAELSYSKP